MENNISNDTVDDAVKINNIEITSNSNLEESANRVQSAGKPGSAGMVGSRRWIAAHSKGEVGKYL